MAALIPLILELHLLAETDDDAMIPTRAGSVVPNVRLTA